MTSCVRVLSTQTLDSSPSILLVAPDGKKTLVNCGEGCQRMFLEFGQKVSSIDRVCLTHLGHETLGGLPGMILTASDVLQQAAVHAKQAAQGNDRPHNKKNQGQIQPGLKLVGPKGTWDFFRSLRHFMRRDSFGVDIREGAWDSRTSAQDTSAPKKSSKKSKQGRTTNENFRVQSIVAYTSLAPSSKRTDRSISPSKKRPRTAFQKEDIPVRTSASETLSTQEQTPLSITSMPSHSLHNDRHQVLSYLFTTPPIPGRFLIERAQALGVPRGPLYGQLKAGKSVTFPKNDATNGGEMVTVESHQVVEPQSPGVAVAVLCYPSLEVLDQLSVSPQLSSFRSTTNDDPSPSNSSPKNGPMNGNNTNDGQTILELIVHMTSHAIFASETCVVWRESNFQKTVRHMFVPTCNERCDRGSSISAFQSAHLGAHLRSKVSSEVYLSPVAIENENQETGRVTDRQESVVLAVPLLEYVLLPLAKRGFSNHNAFLENWERMQDDGLKLVEASGCVQKAANLFDTIGAPSTKLLNTDIEQTTKNGDAEILFTGTGSAVPCKHRNVSGIFVRMTNGNAMLLDVGEGTVGQLLRAKQHHNKNSTSDNAMVVLKQIKAVWISHPHADHHLGILRLLEERTRLLSEEDTENPLVLIAPPNILGFLQEYERLRPDLKNSYIFLDCRSLQSNPHHKRHLSANRHHPQYAFALERLHQDLGIHSCTAVSVAHCANSFAVVFHGTSFGSLAYSGDCRPSKNFSRMAYNADLLIHEATFADGMEADALVKRHCTVGEALAVGKEMNAKTIVLTHFSQRYPKIPKFRETNAPSQTVIHAFDFMKVTPCNIPLASQLTPAMLLLYGDEDPANAKNNEVSDARAALEIPGLFARSELL